MKTAQRDQILLLSGLYFLLSGLSAIFWPQLWYIICGIPSDGTNPFLTTTGMMMVGLGAGSLFSVRSPDKQPMYYALLTANLGDALLVGYYATNGLLPAVNATGLLFIDLGWALALFISLRRSASCCA